MGTEEEGRGAVVSTCMHMDRRRGEHMHAYGPWLAVETDVTKGGARGRCFELGTVGRLDDAVGEVHWGRVRSGDGAVREIVGEAEQLLDVPVGTRGGA